MGKWDREGKATNKGVLLGKFPLWATELSPVGGPLGSDGWTYVSELTQHKGQGNRGIYIPIPVSHGLMDAGVREGCPSSLLCMRAEWATRETLQEIQMLAGWDTVVRPEGLWAGHWQHQLHWTRLQPIFPADLPNQTHWATLCFPE